MKKKLPNNHTYNENVEQKTENRLRFSYGNFRD